MKNASEVYDNPNYSHIMIGGQPFFILPSGELSEHVPVPPNGELLTPRQTEATQHIYEGGSTSYRSTSDYDTDSSTYRPDSDRVSNSFPPIYEEIDSSSVRRRPGEVVESQFHHGAGRDQHGGVGREPLRSVVSPVNTMAVMQRVRGDGGEVVAVQGQHPPRPPGPPPTLHWQGHKSLSPRRPNSSRFQSNTSQRPVASSVYYYSDTLRRRGLGPEDGRDSVQESDSGVSSRSGHNTSSESTPQPLGGDLASARSFRRRGVPAAQQVVSSSEDFHISDQQSPGRGVVVDTQVVVRNANTKREPIVKL